MQRLTQLDGYDRLFEVPSVQVQSSTGSVKVLSADQRSFLAGHSCLIRCPRVRTRPRSSSQPNEGLTYSRAKAGARSSRGVEWAVFLITRFTTMVMATSARRRVKACLRRHGSRSPPWPEPERAEAAGVRGVNALAIAMDMVPRISRAQKVDALSSMANIAGYWRDVRGRPLVYVP